MDSIDIETTRQLLAEAGSGFIADTAFRHLGFAVVGILILVGLFAWIFRRAEKSIGFNFKEAVDNVEEAAKLYVESKGAAGTVWPIPAVLCVVIVCASWIAVTIIRP